MEQTPRRQRARLKAWVYLALLGAGEDADDAETGPAGGTPSGDGQDDRPSPEG